MHAELVVDVLDVSSDRLRTDHQARGDLAAAETFGKELEHRDLTTREQDLCDGRGSCQEVSDACDELVSRKGLDELVVTAEQEAGNAMPLSPGCCHRHTRPPQRRAGLLPTTARGSRSAS
jgi:hypothetical protein